jgi:hypothetical protein
MAMPIPGVKQAPPKPRPEDQNRDPGAYTNAASGGDFELPMAGNVTPPLPRSQMGGVVAPPTGNAVLPPAKPVAAAPAAPPTPAPAPVAAAPQPPTPSTPSPVPGWVPSFDGSGWVPPDHPQAWKAPATPAAGAGPATPAAAAGGTPAPQTAGQALTGAATVGGQPAQGAPATAAGAFQQALLNRLAPEQATAQSAELQPALNANRLAEQRGMERNRAMLAERAAANGTNNSGGFETGLMSLAQDRAGREGQYEAGAVSDLNDKNRSAQLMMAQLAGGMLQNNDAQGLQRYIADQGNQTSRMGIESQTALGRGDLGLRGELGRGQLNLGLLQALMGGEQFGQAEAGQNARFSAGLNQDALFRSLGLL